ncbi:MAG: NAD(P)/FAD-dependent oxidoreductase [Burkholderiaceae bacterium]
MSQQDTRPATTGDDSSPFDALIIGAGFSGLYQLHCLRDKLGLRVQVLEMADDVGGTWYWNRYPGARCDSESHSYCYAFSDEIYRQWSWSERYPGPAEICRYLRFVAEKLALLPDIRFGIRVTGAEYDEAANLWHVHSSDGRTRSAQFLITALGCLSTANIPKIPGLETFEGQWAHTGQWPREGIDLRGKRVGQIGTGSTGIQAAPVIAEAAGHLTVFQRTANYSIPARNGPLTEQAQQEYKDDIAGLRKIMHTAANGHPFLLADRKATETPDSERRAIYEQAWEKGGLRFRASFADLLVDEAANKTAAEFIRQKIREIVKDPATAEILANIDHPFATKRPPVDTHYFETFNRDNVSLVDLRADPIVAITPKGIRTRDHEFELDVIVFATGFDAMSGSLMRLNPVGRNGLRLADAWAAGPLNLLGVQVAGFPNMFTVTGPGSPSVLCNMPVAIEQHVEWITDCIAWMREHGHARIEATSEAMHEWVGKVNAAANATLLPKANSSWYLGANVPGKPRVFMPYAGGMDRFRSICNQVAADGYPGFTAS